MKEYDVLHTIELQDYSPYLHLAETPEVIHLDDPALSVMVDYRKCKPTTVDLEELISNALIEMRACDEHVLLVKDKEGYVQGIISSGDIIGSKPVKVTEDKKISRAQVKVRQVMTPRNALLTFKREDLRHAKVGHIVSTLRAHKQLYAAVVDVLDDGKQTVCGLFSLSKLGKALGKDVLSGLVEAHTLAELQHIHS